jgi:multiple sugar transport system substrate-binding protein
MTTRTLCAALAAALIASTALAATARADTMTMWVRASGTNAAAHLIDLWNSTHPDKIELTTIPDNQMVTKLATGVQAGDAPDLVSFDLIYMPDFMKAGFLVDLTADLKADPDYASVVKAYKDIATYDGKLYGAGFTPDVSILVWNKDLFKKPGSIPTSRRGRSARSMTRKRSARSGPTSTASISPAPAPAATSSPPPR